MSQSDPTEAGLAMIEVIENQLKTNDPPKVKITLNRLMSLGIDRQEALKYIACALSVEIFGAIKNSEEFNPKRYNMNLVNLPDMPWEDS